MTVESPLHVPDCYAVLAQWWVVFLLGVFLCE